MTDLRTYHGKHQQWRPEPVGDGWYRLVARHSGRVLQIAVGRGQGG
ncbi:RICIN domain-containing protein [Streptomyces lasiicapitis]|nr:RICIN domain-containing protein [Streptomyces lasiicapitis]